MIKHKFKNIEQIFSISNQIEFNKMAIEIFNFQYKNNKIYQQYCNLLNINVSTILNVKDIPFLPISFFKTHQVICNTFEYDKKFSSSGTTGMVTSSHFVKDVKVYEKAFIKGFKNTYGNINDYIILGLLPSYLEREGSSLIYMVDKLIQFSANKNSGFFLNNYKALIDVVKKNKTSKKIILIGVSYALLDLAEIYKPDFSDCIIMETGGMKGKRKEIPKTKLHQILKKGLNVKQIHSEYGMTELMSQAYAKKNGEFITPPWMTILIREYNDPFSYTINNKTGGLNIVDLANVYSCSFIATQDLGKIHNSHFEVLGRFDNADVRGCNLLIQ